MTSRLAHSETDTATEAARAVLLALAARYGRDAEAPRSPRANYSGVATGDYSTLGTRYLGLGVGISHAYRRRVGESPADKFRRLADQWYDERPIGDLKDICSHAAYLGIIGMGDTAVPFILKELQRRPGHWFPALTAITGETEVIPAESRGKIKEMAAAWINWGKARALI